MGRAPCCDKANVKRGPWSPEEDTKLKAYIEKYGTGGNWIALPQKIGLKRCGKSCRLRWLNYLRPNIKHGGFSEEEDNIICSLYISIGSRWSIIAAQLPGRTDNDIKNYWNTRLKKKLLGRRKQSNANRLSSTPTDNHDASSSEDSGHPPPLSNSALERLQLHMQLQRLNSPLSYYNNPTLWPKVTPFNETKITNNGQQLLDNNTSYTYPQVKLPNRPSPSPVPENDLNLYETPIASVHHSHDSIKTSASVHHSHDSIKTSDGNSMMDQIMYDQMYMEHVSNGGQPELGGYYKTVVNGDNFVSQENPQTMLDYECFRGMLEDNVSWDSSAPNLTQSQEGSMFQEYELGTYNNV